MFYHLVSVKYWRIREFVWVFVACITLVPEASAQQLPRLNLRSATQLTRPAANVTPRTARMNLRAGGRFVPPSPITIRPATPAPTPSAGANTGGGKAGSTSPAATQTTVTVVPTDAAYAYHKNKQCRTITGPQVATAVEWLLTKAKSEGRAPCKVCYPAPANPAPRAPPKN